MKKMPFRYNPVQAFKVFVCMSIALLFFQSCVALNGERMKNWQEMSPKEKVTVAYSTYNLEYASYMADTGYSIDIDGKWEKTHSVVLDDKKINTLQKKKAILVKMWPMIRLYDNMTIGKIPYSAETESDLYKLIEDLARLVPG